MSNSELHSGSAAQLRIEAASVNFYQVTFSTLAFPDDIGQYILPMSFLLFSAFRKSLQMCQIMSLLFKWFPVPHRGIDYSLSALGFNYFFFNLHFNPASSLAWFFSPSRWGSWWVDGTALVFTKLLLRGSFLAPWVNVVWWQYLVGNQYVILGQISSWIALFCAHLCFQFTQMLRSPCSGKKDKHRKKGQSCYAITFCTLLLPLPFFLLCPSSPC